MNIVQIIFVACLLAASSLGFGFGYWAGQGDCASRGTDTRAEAIAAMRKAREG